MCVSVMSGTPFCHDDATMSILSSWADVYIPARQANDITIQEALAASSNQSQHRLQQIV